jgi:hypothetical protein
MNVKDIDELEVEWKNRLCDIEQSRKEYIAAKAQCHLAEDIFKSQKSRLNKAYKNWKITRIEALRAYRRYKSYPYRVRQWNRQNMERALSLVMEKEFK